jgi:hypothetical protein
MGSASGRDSKSNVLSARWIAAGLRCGAGAAWAHASSV